MTTTALTTTDAFFVAYQEQSGILMHFGAELAVDGAVDRARLEAAVRAVIERWPVLGRTLRRGLGGLRWSGEPRSVVQESTDEREIERWRNAAIDPFGEPPFGVLWVRRSEREHAIVLRCHHAAADGELFFAIVCEVMARLADRVAGSPSTNGHGAGRAHPLGLRRLLKDAKVGASVKHARWLAREAKADRSARIAMREVAPGAVGSTDRRLDARARGVVIEKAREAKVRPAWIAAAAWLQALHAWNAGRGADVFSVEVPVSLRRGSWDGTGNHLAVLTLFADATAPLGDLARGLWRDYAAGVRRRDHLAVPLLANPVRLLPWPVFRRVAVTSTSTGFATTHFTWLVHEPVLHDDVRARSGGALAVRDQRMYTPVCLAMGAALCVLAWPGELQLAITHRLNGITPDDAAALGELLVERLA